MTSEVLHPFASPWVAWLAIGASVFSTGGCAMASEPTESASTESVGSTGAALVQITDREYVDSVREVLGITLAGAETSISGITSASAAEARFDDWMAANYQTTAHTIATQANLTTLLGSETPTSAQLHGFLSEKVSRL